MITAALVTPNLTLGGAERWLVDVVKHSDPARIRWAGVACSSFGGADTHLATELAQHTRLYANGGFNRPPHAKPFCWAAMHEITGPDFRDTVRRAITDTQIVLSWGQVRMDHLFVDYTGPRVLCSHTTLQEKPLLTISGVTHLTAVSEAAMRYFDNRPGAQLPRTVIYNGADPARLQATRSREEIRAAWGIGPGDVVVGYLGRQSEEKNPLAPAQAVSALPDGYYAVYYGFGATGQDFCPSTRHWCEQVIPGRYQMHEPIPQVGDVLNGFDVLVLASHREAFSLTLIEAWLAGVPVVATPVGSVPEMEQRYGTLTFRVPLNPTAAELALAVEKATVPALRDPVVQRAKQLAGEEFTVKKMVERWMTYLEQVVAGAIR